MNSWNQDIKASVMSFVASGFAIASLFIVKGSQSGATTLIWCFVSFGVGFSALALTIVAIGVHKTRESMSMVGGGEPSLTALSPRALTSTMPGLRTISNHNQSLRDNSVGAQRQLDQAKGNGPSSILAASDTPSGAACAGRSAPHESLLRRFRQHEYEVAAAFMALSGVFTLAGGILLRSSCNHVVKNATSSHHKCSKSSSLVIVILGTITAVMSLLDLVHPLSFPQILASSHHNTERNKPNQHSFYLRGPGSSSTTKQSTTKKALKLKVSALRPLGTHAEQQGDHHPPCSSSTAIQIVANGGGAGEKLHSPSLDTVTMNKRNNSLTPRQSRFFTHSTLPSFAVQSQWTPSSPVATDASFSISVSPQPYHLQKHHSTRSTSSLVVALREHGQLKNEDSHATAPLEVATSASTSASALPLTPSSGTTSTMTPRMVRDPHLRLSAFPFNAGAGTGSDESLPSTPRAVYYAVREDASSVTRWSEDDTLRE